MFSWRPLWGMSTLRKFVHFDTGTRGDQYWRLSWMRVHLGVCIPQAFNQCDVYVIECVYVCNWWHEPDDPSMHVPLFAVHKHILRRLERTTHLIPCRATATRHLFQLLLLMCSQHWNEQTTDPTRKRCIFGIRIQFMYVQQHRILGHVLHCEGLICSPLESKHEGLVSIKCVINLFKF